MRTTLDIEDEILAIAKDIARSEKKTTGQVISELSRRGLRERVQPLDFSNLEIRDGLPLLPSRGGVATKELVDQLLEEADWEDAGFDKDR